MSNYEGNKYLSQNITSKQGRINIDATSSHACRDLSQTPDKTQDPLIACAF